MNPLLFILAFFVLAAIGILVIGGGVILNILLAYIAELEGDVQVRDRTIASLSVRLDGILAESGES